LRCFIDYVLFAYNTSVQASTNEIPFKVIYGRDPKLPIDVSLLSNEVSTIPVIDYITKLRQDLKETWEAVVENHERAQQHQQENHNKKAKIVEFKEGDLVLLLDTTTIKGRTKKLAPNYTGPYVVTKRVNEVNYIIRYQGRKTGKTQRVHANRLKLYKSIKINDDFHEGKLDEDELYVEEILDHKLIKNTKFYLVKFEEENDPIWIKEKLLNCPDKLEEFWNKDQRGRDNSKTKGVM